MRALRVGRVALYLVAAWLSGCRGCDSRTVPFKRLQPEAALPDAAAPSSAAEAAAAATSYPEGTQKIRVSDTTVERPDGVIFASLAHDLNADGKPDVLIVASDAEGKTRLELILHDSARASGQLPLTAPPALSGCRTVAATLGSLAEELQLARVDFLCERGEPAPAPPTAASPNDAPPAPEAPPEPSDALPITRHFLFSSTGAQPQLLLRLCANWATRDEPLSSELEITAPDIDGDQHADVLVNLRLTAADEADAKPLVFSWLNRPTGLARELAEPEATLAALGQDSLKLAPKKPESALPIATRALRLHQLLCKEGGAADLWIDDARGVSCGPSAGAGKAAAASAISFAQNQALLPALEARAMMDEAAFVVDKKLREQADRAIGTIRGDTSYRWHPGPAVRTVSAPNLRLPLIGFIDENTLLLRGSTSQAYDLQTHGLTPTGLPGGVLASDSQNRFVLTDILRSCDGLHVRSVPFGRVIGGVVVTGAPASEPLLQPSAASADGHPSAPNPCTGTRPRSDRGGFVLLGMLPDGALFARGRRLSLLPVDAQGQFNQPAREVPSRENLAALRAPGALDQSARYFALATSEGVALIDRAQNSARLVRSPASCAGGQVSDAVLSPSAHKLAMLCGGRVYVAEPAAVSGTGDRPTSETP